MALKWILSALLVALLLIGAGFVLTNGGGADRAISASSEALMLCEEGTADYHAFRLRAAVDKLERALELDPLLAEASIARTFAFFRLGENDNGKAEFARADSLTGLIQDDRRRMLAELRLSNADGSRFGKMRDSLLTRLESEMPENLYVLEAKAMVAVREGDLELQERRWKDILEVDPNFGTSYNMLGYLELRRGEYDKAIEYMQKYAFLVPDQANPHDSLGEVLMVLGRYEEAESAFRRSVTMQPDFYHSLINLGKTYLARGRLDKGMAILDKVRAEVEGSELAKGIDKDIISVFLVAGLERELDEATALFIERYPEDGNSCFYRGVRLAYAHDFDAASAVMDSCLGDWRAGESYRNYPKARTSIEIAAKTFDALLAEAADEPATAVRMWRNTISLMEDERAFHEQWYERNRLAANLHRSGKPEEALAELTPMLAVNPRLFNSLALATECYLDMGQLAPARQALEQLQWCAEGSDPGFPARAQANSLAARLAAAEGGS
jgi:tetratricopeptide (TPR) repeat protein